MDRLDSAVWCQRRRVECRLPELGNMVCLRRGQKDSTIPALSSCSVHGGTLNPKLMAYFLSVAAFLIIMLVKIVSHFDCESKACIW